LKNEKKYREINENSLILFSKKSLQQ
jgi:hypothetical protein